MVDIKDNKNLIISVYKFKKNHNKYTAGLHSDAQHYSTTKLSNCKVKVSEQVAT